MKKHNLQSVADEHIDYVDQVISNYNGKLSSANHRILVGKGNEKNEYQVIRYVAKQTFLSKVVLFLNHHDLCDLRFSFRSTTEKVFSSGSLEHVLDFAKEIRIDLKRDGEIYKCTTIRKIDEERIKAFEKIYGTHEKFQAAVKSGIPFAYPTSGIRPTKVNRSKTHRRDDQSSTILEGLDNE